MQNTIKQLLDTAVQSLIATNKITIATSVTIEVEPTRRSEHGDFASNIALVLAKKLKRQPLELAAEIIAAIPTNDALAKAELAKPGFINFYLTDQVFHQVVGDILQQREKYGHTVIGKNKMAIVEFVSANPTGPLHVGHGRGAAYGMTVADLLTTMGYKVHREYYVNDAGRQMHVLALSVWLRYLELNNSLEHFPASGYQGAYIIDIAKQLKKEHGELLHRPLEFLYRDLPADAKDGGDKEFYIDAMIKRAQSLLDKDYPTVFNVGLEAILADIRQDLEEFGVVFQEWFFESHLLQNGDVLQGLQKLRDNGYVYEQDGAEWFKATAFNDEKDRVITRGNGQTTYFASDVGYHLNKYDRGFDKIIDIFGADHHGYAPRIRAFLQAMQLDVSKLEVLLVQFAILYRGKSKVQMSTRSGEFVTLRQLREEVGKDAARFFYIMRKSDQHLDFDLELAKEKSNENPVYYIQYAHARICSVFRQLEEKQFVYDEKLGQSKLALLNNSHEKELLRQLTRYPLVLQAAALNYEPHVLAYYLRDLANAFHAYYNAYQFLVEEIELRNARLSLISATRQILVNGLVLLGVATPEVM